MTDIKKIGIIGCGNVGASIAYTLMESEMFLFVMDGRYYRIEFFLKIPIMKKMFLLVNYRNYWSVR